MIRFLVFFSVIVEYAVLGYLVRVVVFFLGCNGIDLFSIVKVNLKLLIMVIVRWRLFFSI